MLIKLRNISTTTIDVPGQGMVLRPGSAMWADALTADLQAAIEGGFLEVIDQVGESGSELPDGAVTAAKLAAGLLDKFAVVSWGAASVVNPTTRSVPLQLKNLLSQNIGAAHVVRVTCDERATLAVGQAGTALSGDGTSDLIAKTDATGRLDLTIVCEESITVSVAAGPTQSSPMLDARTGCDVLFQP
jgi:hypothetical protein